jgi:uroporphyrinogen-III decarboxylase
MGSETLAFFSVDCRELLLQAAAVYTERLRQHVQNAIDAGIRGVYSCVGPELFIPPLMTPGDFEDFVFKFDKPIYDLIHNAGGYVWLHVHGKVNNFIDRFIDMGIDVLNPLEPPKNGDIHLPDLVKNYGCCLGWEGNIEIQEILQAEPERLLRLVKECVEAGAPSGRFILGLSAGYMEFPFPEPAYIHFLLLYLEEGYREVEKQRD